MWALGHHRTVPGTHPAVTIVLIAFDDVGNVEQALRSAREQTLPGVEVVAVDDASTDGTAELLDRLAEGDPRVRVLHRRVNSGGCSAPRNAGIDAARGEWVTFLDSDDLLEPAACARLLGAAQRHAADVVCGAMLRVEAHSGRGRVRFGWLYEREEACAGLRDRPELLTDVMVQGKLFRRALLDEHAIRFPEGVLFEDLDVTARALAFAERVAVVPDVVYRHLRHSGGRPSITRRSDLQAATDRIAAQRRLDAFLAEQRLPDAKLAKDVRFLQHDLRDHLRDIHHLDPGDRAATVELARAYLDEVDPRAFARVRPLQRTLIALVRRGDAGAVARAVRVRAAGAGIARRAVDALPERVVRRLTRPARKA
jgi:CDP-glycerol glycerophosphotransferase